MKTILIGPARMRVSSIGMGGVTFGREIDEAAAHSLLDHALSGGVSFFDTAAAYRQGASERILGKWLASRRPAAGAVSIATKILPPDEPARIEERVNGGGAHTVSSVRLRECDTGFPACSLLPSQAGKPVSRSLAAGDSFICAASELSISMSNRWRKTVSCETTPPEPRASARAGR